MLKEKINSQIKDIRNIVLFKALHYKGHALEKHVLTDEQLFGVLAKKRRPIDPDDIIMVTRFNDAETAVNLIADTLLKNINEIEHWLLTDTDCDYVAYAFFDFATGDGLAKNTDCSHTIPVHGMCVVVRKDYSCICNSFVVVTAYPVSSPDDTDIVYECIDEYISRKDA